jgi:hypothetical protein
LAVSVSLVVGVSLSARLWAQDAAQDTKKAEQTPVEKPAAEGEKPAEGSKPAADAPAGDAAKADAKAEPAAPAPPPLKPVPPEVEAKLEAARRAVAEAIVAAQDAGLVDTAITPPPILDILILGQANDRAVLQAKLDQLKADPNADPEAGLSPEVFGAWFSMQGSLPGVDLQKNVRIVAPSAGLLEWYGKRAEILNRHIAEVRKAMGTPEAPKEEAKPAETPKEEAKPAETPKEEAKPAEAPKEEAKPVEAPKEEAKPAETPKEEAKPDADKAAEANKGEL